MTEEIIDIPPEAFLAFESAPIVDAVRTAIREIGWEKPTPVQGLCLPHTLAGKDVAGFAQTGTGKTAVFLITAAHRLLAARGQPGFNETSPSCIIMTPTRELAIQIESDAQTLFKPLGISSLAVYGGIDYEKQAKHLREGVNVIVATPGRLKDYLNKKVLNLDNCQIFVCDEADRMFDMGFISDVEFFMDKIPENCQRLLFSATTNDEVKELAFEYLNKPEYISVNPESLTPENIDQQAIICEAKNKLQVMLGLLRDQAPKCSIIFTNTKVAAEWLHYKLTHNGVGTDIITGDLPQRQRINLIHRIKQGEVKALIATDVASRGLHIAGVTHVYNFDLPGEAQNYVHRIGRTARAGAHGSAISLVCEDYGHNLAEINKLLGERLTIKTEWFDQSYLDIQDKAGNPFQDSESRLSRDRGGDHHKPRTSKFGDKRPGSQDRPRSSASGGRSEGGRSEGGRSQGGRSQGGRSQGGRPQNTNGSGRRPEQPRRNGADRPRQQQPRQQQPRSRHPEHVAAAAAKPVIKPADVLVNKSVTGMVKKLFSTLFGREK